MQPDRTAHPGLMEVKKVYQDIRFSSADPKSGDVTVENHFMTRDLGNYRFTWQLLKNGAVEAEGPLPVPAVKAGETAAVKACSPKAPARAASTHSGHRLWPMEPKWRLRKST